MVFFWLILSNNDSVENRVIESAAIRLGKSAVGQSFEPRSNIGQGKFCAVFKFALAELPQGTKTLLAIDDQETVGILLLSEKNRRDWKTEEEGTQRISRTGRDSRRIFAETPE